MFIILLSISIYTVVAGLYLATDIKIEKLLIKSSKITEPVRIVQISDTHFSQVIGTAFAEKIKKTVNELNPDLVIMTGDFVDHGIIDSEKISILMREINAKIGKYAISGNHEFINGFEQSVEFIKWSGFSFLYSESIDIDKNITLASVTDKSAARFGYKVDNDLKILRKTDKNRFVIFLKHQPDFEEGAENYFDLMLSGHTHGGQFFPFGIFVKIAFNYCFGTYKFSNGSIFHINRGTGTWGPPVRFGAMAEITLINIIPKNIEK